MSNVFSRLIIGSANWGGKYGLSNTKVEDVKDILDYCKCSGIHCIDTGSEYNSESIVAQADSSFKIITKGNGDLNSSLKSLERDRIYGYLLRDVPCCPEHNMGWPRDDWLLLEERKRQGLVEKIGFSIYEEWELVHALKEAKPDILQLPYSLFDRRLEGRFPYLAEKGVEIHVRSIFLQGKILEKAQPRDCLDFVLMNKYVNKVIIGVDNCQQLRDNCRHLHRMDSLEVRDKEYIGSCKKILDPRKWTRKESYELEQNS